MNTGASSRANDTQKLVASLQSMRDRLMGELPGRFGDAFDGDFDTLLDTINFLKRLGTATPGEAGACNCASGRGAEHCVVHAPNDVLPSIATPPASGEAGADTVGELIEAVLAERLTRRCGSGAEHSASTARVTAALLAVADARRLAAVAPAGMDGWVSLTRGFDYANGIHTPTVLVTFKRDDWEARDRFAKVITANATPPATAGQEEWEVCRHLGMENEWSDWAPCPPHLVEQLKTSSSHRLRKKVGRG